jgi:hypothetical protein
MAQQMILALRCDDKKTTVAKDYRKVRIYYGPIGENGSPRSPQYYPCMNKAT